MIKVTKKQIEEMLVNAIESGLYGEDFESKEDYLDEGLETIKGYLEDEYGEVLLDKSDVDFINSYLEEDYNSCIKFGLF